jgi:K+-transporting ATPase KdpF subunit
MLGPCYWSWLSSHSPSSDSLSSIGTYSAAKESSAMQFDDALGLAFTIAGLAYLIFAMLRPEKF